MATTQDNQPHATFMQPLQCVLHCHMADPLVSTHMATEDDNNDAAIPLRSATTDSKPPYYLLLLSGILEFFWALFFFKVRGVAGAAKNENQK